jgi:putative oxidoreductase
LFSEEGIMASEITGKVQLIITWSLGVLLGLAFLGIGSEKLTGTMGTIPFFAAIGWEQWFRYASGALGTVGVLLIFVPRWTSYGALIITCAVGLGTVLCFTMGLFNPLFPLVMTLLAATLAWLAWKPNMRDDCLSLIECFAITTLGE